MHQITINQTYFSHCILSIMKEWFIAFMSRKNTINKHKTSRQTKNSHFQIFVAYKPFVIQNTMQKKRDDLQLRVAKIKKRFLCVHNFHSTQFRCEDINNVAYLFTTV